MAQRMVLVSLHDIERLDLLRRIDFPTVRILSLLTTYTRIDLVAGLVNFIPAACSLRELANGGVHMLGCHLENLDRNVSVEA